MGQGTWGGAHGSHGVIATSPHLQSPIRILCGLSAESGEYKGSLAHPSQPSTSLLSMVCWTDERPHLQRNLTYALPKGSTQATTPATGRPSHLLPCKHNPRFAGHPTLRERGLQTLNMHSNK